MGDGGASRTTVTAVVAAAPAPATIARSDSQRRLDVNPLLAIVITGILAFGAHILFVLALRSK